MWDQPVQRKRSSAHLCQRLSISLISKLLNYKLPGAYVKYASEFAQPVRRCATGTGSFWLRHSCDLIVA